MSQPTAFRWLLRGCVAVLASRCKTPAVIHV